MTQRKFFNTDNLLIALALASVLILVFILISATGKLTRHTLEQASDTLSTQYQKLDSLLNMQLYGQKRNIDLSMMLLAEDPFVQDDFKMAFYEDAAHYIVYRDQLLSTLNDEELQWYRTLQHKSIQAEATQNAIAELALKDHKTQGTQQLIAESLPQLAWFGKQIQAFSNAQAKQTEQMILTARQSIDREMHRVIWTAAGLVLVSFFFAFLMSRRFLKMNQKLKTANDTLERQVRERTQSLTEAKDQLQAQNRQLETLSTTDSLTQLHNRLKVERCLEVLQHRFETEDIRYSILFIDIDHFKQINDTYGHACGDEVLQEMAKCLQSVFVENTHIGRWGGEEFIVVIEHADPQQAILQAENCRQTVAQYRFPVDDTVTISIGLATSEDHLTTSELIHLADEALYDSKHAGRNRVTVYSKETV